MVRFVFATFIVLAGCGSVALEPNARQDGGGDDADADADAGGGVDADASPCGDGACALKPRGSSCGAGVECASAFCADGVCCDVACDHGCVACDQTGRAGTCWPVEEGAPDPHGLCVDGGRAACGHTGTCDGLGACSTYGAGTVCGVSTCVGDMFQGVRVCDGRGTCGAPPPLRACAPYACNPANCLNACISDLGCVAPAVCITGACRPLPAIALSSAGASDEIGGFYPETTTDDVCPLGSVVIGYDVATTPDPMFEVIDRIRTVCGTLRITHAGPLAVEVGATMALAERGSGPGIAMQLRCPGNQVVAGFEGRSGAFVDQLTFRCAALVIANTDDAIALGPITEVGPVGGDGGNPQGATDCGPAEVAVGSRTLADVVVKKLALLCAGVSLR